MRVVFLLILSLLPPLAFAENVKIVVDIPSSYHLVKALDYEAVEVEILFDQTMDVHHGGLTRSQFEKLDEAEIILAIAPALFPPLIEISEKFRRDGKPVGFYYEGAYAHSADKVAAIEGDSHFWLSPMHLMKVQDHYEAVLSKALGRTARGKAQIPTPPNPTEPRQVALLGSHQAFSYFEQDYGYLSFGALHDEHDNALSPRQFSEIFAHVNEGEVRCLMVEAGETDNQLTKFAQDNALELKEFDAFGWKYLGEADFFTKYFDELVGVYEDCVSKN